MKKPDMTVRLLNGTVYYYRKPVKSGMNFSARAPTLEIAHQIFVDLASKKLGLPKRDKIHIVGDIHAD